MFDVPCAQCHDEDNWPHILDTVLFDHTTTGFPLTGSHSQAACISCHADMVFNGTPRDCYRCHEDVHNGELGYECQRCHDTSTFSRVEDFTGFHETTQFPLRGIHRTLMCIDCHEAEGDYQWQGLHTECAGCHYEDYAAAGEPNHIELGIGTDCEKCHLPVPGFRAAFDHSVTGKPLTGVHQILQCSDCHGSTFVVNLSDECVSCHEEDFQNTSDPDHGAVGFSEDCELCHTTNAWIPSTFDHNETGYILTGGHLGILCSECHAGNVYEEISQDCVSCHREDYDSVADPDHAALEFSLNCEECHTTASWTPSLFDHNTTRFPLEGAHQRTACADCHTEAYGLNPPITCFVCHFDEYGEAPEHVTLGFPEDCTGCHSKDAWSPQPYDHPDFPIYSGHHKGEWSSCGTCHITSGDFTVFSCFECHPRQKTDRQHDDERDYDYISSECYRCHPDGRE